MIPPIKTMVLFYANLEPFQTLALMMAVLGGASLFYSAVIPHALANAIRQRRRATGLVVGGYSRPWKTRFDDLGCGS
jgi:hypothetical protein